MSLYTMMESTCLIQRPQIGRDSSEGVTQTFVTIISNLPCSVQQAGLNVIQLYAQRNSVVNTTIYFPQDPGAQVNDLLLATDRTGSTLYYLIKGQAQAVGRGRVWQIEAEWIPEPS